ncbi:hypothetical protein Tco_0286183 [Tanacetum coccineum]
MNKSRQQFWELAGSKLGNILGVEKSIEQDEEVMSLGILDYGVDGMKSNASTIGVSKIGVVDVYDGRFNFSKRDGSTNFNKLVEMYNGLYEDNKVEDDNFVVCDKFDIWNWPKRKTIIDKEDDMVIEDEEVMSLGILDYGVDGTKSNASTIGVSKIGVVDVYDGRFNFSERDGSTNFNKLVEMYNGMCEDNKVEDDDFVVCDKFYIWKWPKRKTIIGTKCNLKYGRWKFDIWNWPKQNPSCYYYLYVFWVLITPPPSHVYHYTPTTATTIYHLPQILTTIIGGI